MEAIALSEIVSFSGSPYFFCKSLSFWWIDVVLLEPKLFLNVFLLTNLFIQRKLADLVEAMHNMVEKCFFTWCYFLVL